MLQLNKENIMAMGLEFAREMQKQPKGTTANFWGELLSKIPQAIADIKATTENVRRVKELEQVGKPTQQPQQFNTHMSEEVITPREKPQNNIVASTPKLKEIITFEFNNLMLEMEKRKEMLQSMSAWDGLQLMLASKDIIINKLIEKLQDVK